MSSEKTKETCGIVMPISSIDGCDEAHWNDVQKVLREAIMAAGLEARLVSDADDIGVIQKRIVQNLYDDPIIVCDVSGKNPNVMFELGMRLAFDKPTIIIKDDQTSYSFDTSPIEHLEYPRDLRFGVIVDFKEKLARKIKTTLDKARSDQSYTPFLGHFGTFKAVALDEREGSISEVLLEEMRELRSFVMQSIRSTRIHSKPRPLNALAMIGLRSAVTAAISDLEIASLDDYKTRAKEVYSWVYDNERTAYEICGDAVTFERTIDQIVDELILN